MPRLVYPLPPATIDDIARAATCSARTVRRYLARESVSWSSAERIGKALRARRFEQYVRPSTSAEHGAAA